MTRAVLLLTALVMCGGIGLAAPAPKEKAEAPYYPTTEGVRQVYETRSGTFKSEATHVVTKVETKDKVVRVSTGYEVDKKIEPHSVVEVSDAEIVRVSGPGTVGPPKVLLELPLKVGGSWTWEMKTKVNSLKEIHTFVGEEVIEVPAGKFKAARVDVVFELNGQVERQTRTWWYAHGVGLVKDHFRGPNGEVITELMSMTSGK